MGEVSGECPRAWILAGILAWRGSEITLGVKKGVPLVALFGMSGIDPAILDKMPTFTTPMAFLFLAKVLAFTPIFALLP